MPHSALPSDVFSSRAGAASSHTRSPWRPLSVQVLPRAVPADWSVNATPLRRLSVQVLPTTVGAAAVRTWMPSRPLPAQVLPRTTTDPQTCPERTTPFSEFRSQTVPVIDAADAASTQTPVWFSRQALRQIMTAPAVRAYTPASPFFSNVHVVNSAEARSMIS